MVWLIDRKYLMKYIIVPDTVESYNNYGYLGPFY